MSSFGQSNWWQNLGQLFGQQPGAQAGAPQFQTQHGLPQTGGTLASLFHPAANPIQGVRWYRDPFEGGGGQQAQQPVMPTYGQVLAGGALADFQRGEQARKQELGAYLGLLGNLAGSMQGAGQMVQDVRAAQGQGMQLAQQQADQIRQATQQGQQYFDQARSQMERSLAESQRQMQESMAESRRRYDQSIGTLQRSKSEFDFGRRDDTAAQVMGVQQQYKNQLDSIARRDDLTAEQKALATDELRQGMRQQSTALAAQADAQARQTMLALDQNIAQMQASAAAGLGQLGFGVGQAAGQMGIGVGQAIGQLGAQTAAQRQQAEENIANFFNNVQQYNTSMLQGAQAAALNYTLQGNQAMASIINAAPFGPTSIFGTIAHMIQAVDEDRSNRISPQMGQMFGSLS